ncbi:MAG: ABC transporter ATP-binding protein [Halolamina sp.]|uniref:ABC transporter ATP-binding protein n=1 Tax=Halolamina sp. TaxID=1940283 RepID=UPI002FC34BE3
MSDPLLSVDDLKVQFNTDTGVVKAVDGISFDVHRGETVCIVGESGSGKSVTAESITRLIPQPPGKIAGGSIEFDGMELTDMPTKELLDLRGERIAHVFQNPQGALNPVYTIGHQIAETLHLHRDVSKKEGRNRAIDLLDRVGIPDATKRVDEYPHEFSGGMKQRAVIAMALAADPDLLIADEPTTALDVSIQAQILDLLRDLQEEFDMSVIFVTHDLGVVAEIADRVVVMYAGKVMERGDVFDLFEDPGHPYTRALLNCRPGQAGDRTVIEGSLPSAMNPPDGCRFNPRCSHAVEECRTGEQPPMYERQSADQAVSCVHYGDGFDPAVIHEDGETGTVATDGGVEQ